MVKTKSHLPSSVHHHPASGSGKCQLDTVQLMVALHEVYILISWQSLQISQKTTRFVISELWMLCFFLQSVS